MAIARWACLSPLDALFNVGPVPVLYPPSFGLACIVMSSNSASACRLANRCLFSLCYLLGLFDHVIPMPGSHSWASEALGEFAF